MPELDPQPRLSALALIEAYRTASYEDVDSILTNTTPHELHVGLVQLSAGLLASLAAVSGCTVGEMADTYRSGLWKAATA